MFGDCVWRIVRELHGETCLCIVRIGVKQQYGEDPDTYNSSAVKARTGDPGGGQVIPGCWWQPS